MKKALKILVRILWFVLLTIVTQIGGVALIISHLLSKSLGLKTTLKRLILFIVVYTFLTLLITPWIAPMFGRERVKHTELISPANYMTVLLNRNYVRPELNQLLGEVEKTISKTGISISYLDANFPFINKFPLLPHLSHNDGKKLDLSLIHESSSGDFSDKQRSMSGYGVFEGPRASEYDQTHFCKEKGYFQYDFSKYLSFGEINAHLKFSEKGTKILLQALLTQKRLSKIFIEPHLKSRLNLAHPKIRFHGCGAVRHDDHIHLEIK
ncbi:MAG: hypothetical protein AB8B53_13100 [Flavobacteriales bacterium]